MLPDRFKRLDHQHKLTACVRLRDRVRPDCKDVWVDEQGRLARIGVSEFALLLAHPIEYVEFPTIGREVEVGAEVGVVESARGVSDLGSPLAGTVTKINSALEHHLSLMNGDCYGEGWVVELEVKRPNDYCDWRKRADESAAKLMRPLAQHDLVGLVIEGYEITEVMARGRDKVVYTLVDLDSGLSDTVLKVPIESFGRAGGIGFLIGERVYLANE